jgi:basic membrane protein A
MKKRICFILAAAITAVSLAGCGDAKQNSSDTADVKGQEAGGSSQDSDDPLKVVYLVNGNLGDKGFYDSAASGLKMMEEKLGAETKIIEMGRDETSYEGNYLDVSEQDWDMIISGTWSVKELSEEIAAQFPEKNYMFFDGEVDYDVVTDGNMMGVSYYSNQGAFMAGCLAARMLESGDEKIDDSKKILGFVGSMDTVNINDFLVGYLDGIRYINPEIKVMVSYVGSFEDVSKCMEMTTQLYNQGAQIVYAPASQSILGAVTAASNNNKYLIACDQDIYAQLQDSDPELAKAVLSSSLKNVGDSLFTAVEGFANGTMTTDQNYIMGLDSGAVGLAKNENYEANVPEDIRKELEEIEGKIIDGEIEVRTAFQMSTEEVVSLRDEMKP